MSSLTRGRRLKRPTTLAKRSTLAKKSFYNKRSYKPLYENVKGNNNALAKALSNMKQENQYLFSENLALVSQVQELQVACNRRDDIISSVLKNAKDSLGLFVNATNCITNTIVSCQQFVNMPKLTPRKSTSATDRRDSNRRLSGKSPARGVVQPMVSGHTITKPTINLSRLNLQTEFRDRNRFNLSDIQELTTPTNQSPDNRRSASPAQAPTPRTLNCVSRRVDRMPERLRRTLRTSDESPRRSSGRGVRNSRRRSLRRSPERSDVSPVRINNDESLRSPRVSLHDVSRLLHNAQTVNVRTLLDASSEMERGPSRVSPESPSAPEENLSLESSQRDSMDKSAASSASKSQRERSVRQDSEDPMEGPSWLLNDSEAASPTRDRDSEEHRIWEKEEEEEEEEDDDDDMRTDLNLPMFVTRKRGSSCDDTEDFTLLWRKAPPKNYNFGINDLVFPVIESPIAKAPEVQVPEPEITANIQTVQTQNFSNLTFCRPIVDPDDETVYLHPTAPPPAIDNTELFDPSPVAQRATFDHDEQSSFHARRNFNSIAPPSFFDNTELSDSSLLLAERPTSEHDDPEDFSPTRRKIHPKNPRLFVIESPSDSDYSPAQQHKKSKSKRSLKTKDPSSAKVVLRKLKDDSIAKCSVSPERRRSEDDHRKTGRPRANPDPSTDSEVSNGASLIEQAAAGITVRGRPRRQKAPRNLQEPSLGKKLRRG